MPHMSIEVGQSTDRKLRLHQTGRIMGKSVYDASIFGRHEYRQKKISQNVSSVRVGVGGSANTALTVEASVSLYHIVSPRL